MDSNLKNPYVTVLMPVYNGEKYLKQAIESILNQTFKDFEFLIINDGSTDSSKKIIKSFKDSRIKLINNEKNIKIAASLNKGLNLAQGKYIARMDCDDISLKNRLTWQIEFMNKNPQIGISGGFTKKIGTKKSFTTKYFLNHDELKANMLFNASMSHPTIIMHKNLIEKHKLRYNKNFSNSQDRELWSRAIKFFKFANLNKVILYHRIHNKNESSKNSNIQKENANKTIINQLKKLNLSPSEQELKIHRAIKTPINLKKEEFIKSISEWYQKIIKANKKTKTFNEKSLLKILSKKYFNIYYNLSDNGFWAWKKYWKSDFAKNKYHSKLEIIKFFIRCLFKKSP